MNKQSHRQRLNHVYYTEVTDAPLFNVGRTRTDPSFGWPQLILSVFEIDALGRDVIRGYGCIHLPIAAGQFTRKVPLYKPLSASVLQQARMTGGRGRGKGAGEPSHYRIPALPPSYHVCRACAHSTPRTASALPGPFLISHHHHRRL